MTTSRLPARGWAASAANAPLAPLAFERRAAREDDVVVDIAWCGICHTDLHIARDEWHRTTFPCVPGHEIVGTVREVGAAVTRFAPGDTVGVGCMVDACLDCDACRADLEQYCSGTVMTYNGWDRDFSRPTFGGYTDVITVREHFVVRIPAALDPASAAPILCAGITTYSPLRALGVGPGTRVGVAGFGGLGLMAIKLAAAMGANVTAITRSPGKADRARAAGAHDVVLMGEEDDRARVRETLDVILDTVPVDHPLDPYLQMLGLDGRLVLVGAIEPLTSPTDARLLVFRRRAVSGSLIGGLRETQEVLDFCAEHGITADIEKIGVEEINAAYDRMAAGQLDFRYVIDMSTL